MNSSTLMLDPSAWSSWVTIILYAAYAVLALVTILIGACIVAEMVHDKHHLPE